MDYSREVEDAPVYFINDINPDEERSDPELYSNSSATCSTSNTLASSEVHDFFQEAHGRKFPADTNVAIPLPTDSIEVQRSADQHRILKAFFGSIYWGPVDQVLTTAPGQKERKKVLDMVTADGSWAQEMSLRFPHVDILSLDNIPLTAHVPRPNIDFQVYDLYNGIAAPDETFDVAHMRFTMMRLTNLQDVIRDIHRVLKPGGLFVFSDTELGVFDALSPERVMSEIFPSLSEGFEILRAALARQGVKVYIGRELAGWLAPDSDTWASVQPKEPGRPVGFRNIERKRHLVPAGPWPEDARLKMVGRAGGRAWEHMWRSMEAPLQLFGQDEANAKWIVQGAVEEINRPGVPIAAAMHTAYAFKI
ncbi:hypothetical protein FRC08_013542 [Ceratobasidium sp. 394]|nr:hypothetical protein FRC08_013542 [Ceratobasidium sp. 394]KAG9099986.1 hypothetical protein FS749_016555 [Ceratobasidium sp. UAMH 11750]